MDFGEDHHRRNSYSVNGKIMVTAIISLSLVVVLVALLHIYVRCVLRRQVHRRAALRQLGFYTTSEEPPKAGLDPTVIASLPIFTFKQQSKVGTAECTVCLGNLEDGELIRVLPNCKHIFHAGCIDKWLSTNSTCPVCRTEVEPVLESGESPVTAAQATAPPLDHGLTEGTSEGSVQCSGKVNGSSSGSFRLSSFRKMLNWDKSSQQIHSQEDLDDLERQA